MKNTEWQSVEVLPTDSRRVLVATANLVLIGCLSNAGGQPHFIDGENFIIPGVYVWAELPEPPAQGASPSLEVSMTLV
jgi:hypothetical protein